MFSECTDPMHSIAVEYAFERRLNAASIVSPRLLTLLVVEGSAVLLIPSLGKLAAAQLIVDRWSFRSVLL